MRWPSSTPAGTRTFTVRGRTSMPRPLQCLHLSLTTVPRPPHVGHTCENENGPWSTATAPRTATRSAHVGKRARLRAAAAAHRTWCLRRDVHRRRDAVHRVEEVEVELGLEVVAALRPGRPRLRRRAAAPAEQVAEDVAEAAHVTDVLEADVLEAARIRPGRRTRRTHRARRRPRPSRGPRRTPCASRDRRARRSRPRSP